MAQREKPVRRARKAVGLTLALVMVLGVMGLIALRNGMIPAPMPTEVTATGMRWDVADNRWSDLGDKRGLELSLAYAGGEALGAVDVALARAVCWQVLAKLDMLGGETRMDLARMVLRFQLDPAAEPALFTVPVVNGRCNPARAGGPGGISGGNDG